ncbi:hypothetical protein HEP87_45360 [Streptomyces sp. S1D4-11]
MFLLRSLLPFDLHLTITGAFEETESRVLRGVVGGDLEGVSGWSVRPHGTGSRAVLEQDMVARKALIRRLEVPFRPLFRANHYLPDVPGAPWSEGMAGRRSGGSARTPGGPAAGYPFRVRPSAHPERVPARSADADVGITV